MALKVDAQTIEGGIQLDLKGAIDENAEIPNWEESPAIFVNLKEVTHLNSNGIRTWCRWIGKHEKVQKILSKFLIY